MVLVKTLSGLTSGQQDATSISGNQEKMYVNVANVCVYIFAHNFQWFHEFGVFKPRIGASSTKRSIHACPGICWSVLTVGLDHPQKLGQKHPPKTKPAVTESLAAKFKTPYNYFSIGNLTQQQTRQPGLQPGLLKVSSGMVPSLVNSAFSPSPLQGMDGTPAVCARMPAAILSPSTDLKGWWVGSPTLGKIQLKIDDMIYQTCYMIVYIQYQFIFPFCV